jgi:opacity protein-like surface antigen
MRSVFTLVALLACSGIASAQSAPASRDSGYIEVVAQSAFSNVTSQSYGIEGGFTIHSNLQIFAEGGQIKSVTTDDFNAAAQTVAGAISRTQTSVGFTAKEPATFFDAGIRYIFGSGARTQPYVLAGVGAATVKRNATFTVAGADVTSSLSQPQYGAIVLGSDVSGSETKPMLVVGGGLAIPIGSVLNIDLQARFGDIFTSDKSITVFRVGVGLGVRF